MSIFFRHRRRFVERLDRARIEEAICCVERATAAPVRVAVLPHVRGDVVRAAELAAAKLGLTSLPERHGVVIAVVPARRAFAVWGDRAAHEKIGDASWKAIAAAIAEPFQRGDFTAGLVAGVEAVGRHLAAAFPPRPHGT